MGVRVYAWPSEINGRVWAYVHFQLESDLKSISICSVPTQSTFYRQILIEFLLDFNRRPKETVLRQSKADSN